MVAPIPELMATFRVLVVPWALPSNECDCEVLTVEAPFSVPVDRVCADRRPPLDPTGVLLTVNSDEATMTHTRFTVNSQHPEILGDLPAGGASCPVRVNPALFRSKAAGKASLFRSKLRVAS